MKACETREPYGSDSIAVLGAGYWGKNHVRNFYELGAITHVCDSDSSRLTFISNKYPELKYTTDYDEILSDPEIKGVVISTPAVSHHELTIRALKAGKDVLVEKPLALDVVQAREMVHVADQNGRVLMVGHILLYHPAVLKLKEIVDSGQLGKILYIQSNRLGMGKVRSEENILWSFAPHDISIILYLLNEFPSEITATGSCHLQSDVEDMTTSVLKFPSGVGAHIYVSWMNPFKEQRLVVIGDKNMAVFDDTKPVDKLEIYNTNFEWVNRIPQPIKGQREAIPFEPAEPLKMECMHFLECIKTGQKPRSDGEEGLRTLRVLQACYDSMKAKPSASCIVQLQTPEPSKDYFAHETAAIDEPCSIGSGTKIWHFSHVMKDATIGEKCNIGANVLIGVGTTIGNGCKIQNNVSVYEGVILEDYVFCGPSMVFTNVYNPRCEIPRMKELRHTLVKRGATIGANATIVCGHTIGRYAFIGAGSVVTKDVPDYALMVGNPARQIGWMCACGSKLQGEDTLESVLTCGACAKSYSRHENGISQNILTVTTNIKVPLLDLKQQYYSIKTEIDQAIQKVIESQHFILGPEVESLEKEIAAYCGAQYAVGVSSGTDALLISLMALGVGPGDEVITTPFTFFATVGSIVRVGATPVFADIEPDTFNIDPLKVEERITARTKACIPVHLFGQSTNMDPLRELANKYGLALIEDAAQALGTEYKGKRVGTLGNLGCFSFFPSKNLGAFGDGGIVVTNDPELAERLRILRNHGSKPKYYHKIVGGNFRLDSLQAAVLRVKLKHLETWTAGRRKNAELYNELFRGSGLSSDQFTAPPLVRERHIYNQYVIRVRDRDSLKKFLASEGISTEIYYPLPMHLQECFAHLGYLTSDFPVSELAAKEVLAIPIYPELTDDKLRYVVEKMAKFYQC